MSQEDSNRDGGKDRNRDVFAAGFAVRRHNGGMARDR